MNDIVAAHGHRQSLEDACEEPVGERPPETTCPDCVVVTNKRVPELSEMYLAAREGLVDADADELERVLSEYAVDDIAPMFDLRDVLFLEA
ncbi:hypothetical protein [Halorubrum sp. BV1]|uniref:hypothetical protein n=1 Tax=Halorubrum sp. BV1 TaxID=1498500 RepID=UPI0006788C5C|nr:hypothetical protein [Halorubrum sp. BV1]